ncbi:MAG: hypothetical protein ACE5F1_14980 [Planctomycetota bacterium]
MLIGAARASAPLPGTSYVEARSGKDGSLLWRTTAPGADWFGMDVAGRLEAPELGARVEPYVGPEARQELRQQARQGVRVASAGEVQGFFEGVHEEIEVGDGAG